MTYILLIWTVIACDSRWGCKYDWRPLSEFHANRLDTAKQMCENAARELGLKTENYRCVRNR